MQAKLAEIEQEHDFELAESEGLREPVDAKAEARALSAVFDYFQNCKLTPTESPTSRVQALFARAEGPDPDRRRGPRLAVQSELRLGRSPFRRANRLERRIQRQR